MHQLSITPIILTVAVTACGSGEEIFSHPVFADDDFSQVAFMRSKTEKTGVRICISESPECPSRPVDHQLVLGMFKGGELSQVRSIGKTYDGPFDRGSLYYVRSAGYIVVKRSLDSSRPGVFIVTPDGEELELPTEPGLRVAAALPSRDGQFVAVVQLSTSSSNLPFTVSFFDPKTAERIAQTDVESGRWMWTDDGLFRGAKSPTGRDDPVLTVDPSTGQQTQAVLDACYLSETTSRDFNDQTMKFPESGLFPDQFKLKDAGPTVDCNVTFY